MEEFAASVLQEGLFLGTNPAAEPFDPTNVSDKELIGRYRADPSDQEAFGELWKRHERTIKKLAAHFGRLCPSSYSPDIFTEELFSLTQEKVARKLHTYEGRATFSTWLYKIIAHMAIELRRKITGRDPKRFRKFVDLDALTESELANSYAILRDKVKEHPFARATAAERKRILRNVLQVYASSREGYDSLYAVLLHSIDECTIAEIARRFLTYHRKINEMLAHDYLALRESFAEIGITKIQDLVT